MRRLFLMALVPALLSADTWVKYTSGPFEVLTNAGSHAGRETLLRFEEFRNAVGQIVGEADLTTAEPVRILVFKNAQGWTTPAPIVEGRGCHAIVLAEKSAITPALYRDLTRLFLTDNTARMPEAFERGLEAFFSTFEVKGIHNTVGTPPAQPDLDWARVHLLVVDPQYYGRLRVLLFNLRKGVEPDPAYRNAFGKSAAEIETQARQHFAAGHFETTSLDSRPLAEGDFHEKPVSDADARLARADLLAGAQSAAEYQGLIRDQAKLAEAHEGLGLLALREHRNDEARTQFKAAMDASSGSARCYIEYARLEPDNAKATQALLRAAGINPKLDEPFALMARRDTDPQKRLAHWKAAAERNPRNAAYWQALADCYLADHNYAEAAKAWTQGEQAATDPAERERMRQARAAIEQQRLDYEEAVKRRQAEEDARELARLKAQALAEVHSLEAKYNDGTAPKPDSKAVPWWDGPQAPGHVRGTLTQVDCLGKQARLIIVTEDHKTVRLLVTDSDKVSISGAGELTLGCGQQKPRRLSVDYFPKSNARLATAGEVAIIEFQ